MPARTKRTGGYTPSEGHAEIVPTALRAGAPVVLVAHGGGATYTQYSPITQRRDLLYLAELGFVVGIADFAGGYGACTDDGLAAADAYLAYLEARYNCDTSTVGWIADSFGCFLVLGWGKENPARFGGGIMRVPGTSLADLVARNPLGTVRAGIFSAFGSETAYDEGRPDHDPSHPTFVADLLAGGANSRMVLRYNPGDTIALESVVLRSAAELRIPAEVLAPASVTGTGFQAHAPWGWVDRVEQGRWLKGRMGV